MHEQRHSPGATTPSTLLPDPDGGVSACTRRGACLTPLSYNTGGSSGDDPAGSLFGFGVEASISRARAEGFVCGEVRFWKFARMLVDEEVRGVDSDRADTEPLVAVSPGGDVCVVVPVKMSAPSGIQKSGHSQRMKSGVRVEEPGIGMEYQPWPVVRPRMEEGDRGERKNIPLCRCAIIYSIQCEQRRRQLEGLRALECRKQWTQLRCCSGETWRRGARED